MRSNSISCTECGRSDTRKNDQETKPSNDFSAILPPTMLDFSDETSQDEIEIRKLQANLASVLGIPTEAISMISSDVRGRLVVKSAYIFLSATDIKSMIDRLSNESQ